MMNLKLEKANYGKLLLVGASVLVWLLIVISLRTVGYHETWGIWKIPSWLPVFLDFRLIPGSAESFAHGYEPSVENPFDPNQRIFNYPAFWRLFFYTGITQDDTVWISVTMLILFFSSVFLFPEKLSIPDAVGMLLVLFSPASMLLYERGNVDLIVFFICAMIVYSAGISASLATFLILLGSVMKLFPILGLSVLLREPKKKFLWLSGVSIAVLLVYMILTWDSVQASWTLTMRGDGISYGTHVFVDRYADSIALLLSQWLTPHRIDLLLQHGPRVMALLLLLAAIFQAVRGTGPIEAHSERNFAAFRMGASIYAGTFLLGNNWDYRLAFLVLTVPQLLEWMRSTDRNACVAAWLSWILVLLSCWHFSIVGIPLPFFNTTADSINFWIVMDEVFNWMLFVSFTYLLFASAPRWLMELPASLLPKRGLVAQHSQDHSRPTVS